jgi:hypothetical protein
MKTLRQMRRMLDDAELGKLVRKMPVGSALVRVDDRAWSVDRILDPPQALTHPTPLAALRAESTKPIQIKCRDKVI